MQIVIDIDTVDYEYIKNGCIIPIKIDNHIYDAIRNGTPLPKGHGKIYTEKDMRSFLKCGEYDTCIWKNCSECNNTRCITKDNLYKVNAIIEADNAESEDKE